MQLMSILFTSNPLVGHWLPMLPLARAAQRAGHEVAVTAGPDAVAGVERRGFIAWFVGWDSNGLGWHAYSSPQKPKL